MSKVHGLLGSDWFLGALTNLFMDSKYCDIIRRWQEVKSRV